MKKLTSRLKGTLYISLAFLLAFAFIWQRVFLHNLSQDIKKLESDLKVLEQNKSFIEAELMNQLSLQKVEQKAGEELGMINTAGGEILFYSDSLSLEELYIQPAKITEDIPSGDKSYVTEEKIKGEDFEKD